MQRDPVDSESTGRLGKIAARLFNHALGQLTFQLGNSPLDLALSIPQVLEVSNGRLQNAMELILGQADPLWGDLQDLFRQVRCGEGVCGGERDHAMNQVFEFSYIAWKGILSQQIVDFPMDGHLPAIKLREFVKEMIDEQRDVVPALTQ